ncbi:hypothetical protein EDB80DRAFT_680944 [Ilyonectria destructans]|nr:hypothetical protein EDB80DRAFT_680944 [Ilyonectria destructans]
MTDSLPKQDRLHQVLNDKTLDAVRSFWFRHIPNDDHIIVPDKEEALVWFSQNDDYDQDCAATFGDILGVLKSIDASVADILAAANPNSALDWMSLVILLDQIPRNCFRGPKAGVAYGFFDPLAFEVATRAIKAGIPEQPEVRYGQAYRFWFYMPLEHSEKLEVQEQLVQEHDKLFSDAHKLMHGLAEDEDAVAGCREVMLQRQEQLDIWESTLRGIAKQHIDTIKEHGRYPHRDEALGR